MANIHSIKGLVTMVTGGVSGLGRATVERFLKNGSKVVICDLKTSDGKNVAEKLGKDCIFAPGDVTSEEEMKSVLSAIKSGFGRLDVVVNCAGIGIAFQTYSHSKGHSHSFEDFKRVLMVNTVGTFNVVRLASELIAENEPWTSSSSSNGQRGVFINTSSVAAFEGQTGQSAYSASKRAVAEMTLPISRDLASLGIRCCAIAPGLFESSLLIGIPSSIRSQLGETIPFPQRFGDPDEFAHLVQFLVENPYMNGETIRIDGALRLTL